MRLFRNADSPVLRSMIYANDYSTNQGMVTLIGDPTETGIDSNLLLDKKK